PIERHQFTIGVPLAGTYTEVFNTEMSVFGGVWQAHNADQKTKKSKWKSYDQTLSFTLPALGAVIWQVLAAETDNQTEALSSKSYEPLSQAYLTDQQWAVLAPYFPIGSRSKYDKRDLVSAVLFIKQTGRPWTKLPDRFPPYKTVYAFYKRATKLGIWQRAISDYETLKTNN
ncbi:MAG: transposase, partial [Lactococcus sp.]|nr:transposase [Lactococcus sp.]